MRLLLIVFATLLSLLPGLAQAQGLEDPRDAAKVLVEATATGDADAIANLYAPNALILAPGAPIIAGRNNIRQVFANNFARGQNAIEFGSIQADGAGTRAIVLWDWVSTLTPADGQPVQTKGRSLVYFVRADEGWLISADMFQAAP